MNPEVCRFNIPPVRQGPDGPFTGIRPTDFALLVDKGRLFDVPGVTFAELSRKKIATIDMTKTFSLESEAQTIVERLIKDGIYKPNLLFHCFNGDRAKDIMETGRENPNTREIFCSTKEELSDSDATALEFAYADIGAEEYTKRGIAIYDGDLMMMSQEGRQDYIFKPGVNPKDAVVKIYFLKYKEK